MSIIIRIGSKMLAYNPYRFLNDPGLIDILSRYSTPEKRIYIMAHFNHPREMTDITMQVVEQLHRAGIVVVNQTPVLNEVNSDPDTLYTALPETLICRSISLLCVPMQAFSWEPSLPDPCRILL